MAMSELKRTENSVLEGKEDVRIGVPRHFTPAGSDPFDSVEMETRTALIPGKDGPSFEQRDVEFPTFWSQTATNIVAQKYFRGKLNSPEREHSVRQMIGRVADTITAWGLKDSYFADGDEAETFRAELTHPAAAPAGGVQLAGVVQRRLRGAPAVLGVPAVPGSGLDPRRDGADRRARRR